MLIFQVKLKSVSVYSCYIMNYAKWEDYPSIFQKLLANSDKKK